MSHTLTNVLVHVVFATKNREKRLTAAVRDRLHAYLTAAIKDEGGCAYIVNGGLEHGHPLPRKLKTNRGSRPAPNGGNKLRRFWSADIRCH